MYAVATANSRRDLSGRNETHKKEKDLVVLEGGEETQKRDEEEDSAADDDSTAHRQVADHSCAAVDVQSSRQKCHRHSLQPDMKENAGGYTPTTLRR